MPENEDNEFAMQMLQLNKKKVGKNEEVKSEGGNTDSEIDKESKNGDVDLLDAAQV